MPRVMPGLRAEFTNSVAEAIKLAEIGERARAATPFGTLARSDFHHTRVELLYELAFLRIFLRWEAFLEQVLFRYMCGYTSPAYAPAPAPGNSLHRTLSSAEAAVLGGRAYFLWHNPTKAADRSAKFLASSPVETVLRSNLARLEYLGTVRHRIVHDQSDARRKFDAATMNLAGKRFKGSRAGTFLRDVDATATPPTRWLDLLGQELVGLAGQIA